MIIDMTEENNLAAAEVLSVFVDKKRVLMPLLINEKEGWVDAALPQPPPAEEQTTDNIMSDAEKISSVLEVAEPSFKTARLFGKVTVLRRTKV